MIGGMNVMNNPMTAMAGFYAAAFEQGARAWMKQAEIWSDAFSRAAIFPPSAFAAGVPFSPSLFDLSEVWLDPVSVELFEMEDGVAVSASCRDVRIDMMITISPEAESGKPVTIDGVAERIEAHRPRIGRA